MSRKRLYETIEEMLIAGELEEAESDAWLLFSHVTGLSRASFHADPEAELPDEEEVARKLFSMAKRRLSHEPVQYILKEQYFYGRPFYVDERVLIPRQDTEILVDLMVRNGIQGPVLELCTGSGCIAVTLALEKPELTIVATDISTEALAVAKKNAKALNAEVTFLAGDLFAAVGDRQFKTIAANPPYIDPAEEKNLMPEVRAFEPHLALFAGHNGRLLYERLITEAPKHLMDEGEIFLEIGYDQGEAVSELLKKAGFEEVCVIRDLAGLPRVVRGRKACLNSWRIPSDGMKK